MAGLIKPDDSTCVSLPDVWFGSGKLQQGGEDAVQYQSVGWEHLAGEDTHML